MPRTYRRRSSTTSSKNSNLHSFSAAVADKIIYPAQITSLVNQGSLKRMEEKAPVEVTDLSWERVVEQADLPALVMFYSPACPHCRTMEPYFAQYAEEYAGRVIFARIDINTNRWTAERYGVRSTPTFSFFCRGRLVSDLVGAVYPALLKRLVEEGLANGEECVRNSSEIDYEISGYG